MESDRFEGGHGAISNENPAISFLSHLSILQNKMEFCLRLSANNVKKDVTKPEGKSATKQMSVQNKIPNTSASFTLMDMSKIKMLGIYHFKRRVDS